MRRALLLTLALVTAAGLLGWAAWRLARPAPGPRVAAGLSVAEAMAEGGDTAGYERAFEPRAFTFPADHGAHPDFRTEWWYVTGHLESAEGRLFGFQLTFFRNALAPASPDEPERSSAWATRQVYLAHFALTDVGGGRFFAFERLARGAAGLAGATSSEAGPPAGGPYRVWLQDWSLQGAVPGGFLPMELAAAAETEDGTEIALELRLDSEKPPVLQGDRGLSQKGPEPGNASYYYSLTRLSAAGDVRLGGERLAVTGGAWLDREWSTSALGAGEVGWDWFSLQLDDGRELMLYQIRREGGGASPLSKGKLVLPSGEARTIPWSEIELGPTGRWRSPETGAVYPSGWRLTIPSEGLDLVLRPVLLDQELVLSFQYWEGAVTVETARPEGGPSGRGYVELTGYGER